MVGKLSYKYLPCLKRDFCFQGLFLLPSGKVLKITNISSYFQGPWHINSDRQYLKALIK